MLNIYLASPRGFCSGVRRAVGIVEDCLKDYGAPIYVLHEIVHNRHVVEDLETQGVVFVESLDDADVTRPLIFSAHGVSEAVIRKAQDMGFKTLIDATCPLVEKVHRQIRNYAQENMNIVVIGKSEHPEVIAIKANAELYTDKVVVASSVEKLKPLEAELKSHKKIGVVVQTTQRITTLTPVVEYLTSLAKELHVANTICASTSMRQTEAKELAQNSDLMIVVGSKKSANTTHLAEILKDITKTIHIENDEELENYIDLIKNAEKISITAGASTPQEVIEKVINKIRKGE